MKIENFGFLADLERDPWHMEERALHAFLSKVADISTRVAPEQQAYQAPAGYTVEPGGVAVIPVRGTLMKSVPSYFARWEIAATSYLQIEKQITEASSDPNVKSIRLEIDSHGGSSAGVKRAGDAIHSARSSGKPILARVEDVACSAAYWLAAQADEISAAPMALIGSIGTYLTFMDLERLAKNFGVEVKVISSGPLKGAGVPGTRLTPEQEKDLQKWVDDLTGVFVSDVARGRGLGADKVKTWATGGTWLGPEALRMGLVDRVESHREMIARSAAKAAPRMESVREEPAAGEGARPAGDSNDRASEPKGELPMTEAEIKALREKAESDARASERDRVSKIQAAYGVKAPELAQKAIAEGWTIEQTKAAYADIADQRAEAAEKARTEAEKQAAAAKAAASNGGTHVPVGGKPADQVAVAEKDFVSLAEDYAKEHGCSMRKAMTEISKANPAAWSEHLRQIRVKKD